LNAPDSAHWRRTSPYAILFFVGRILRLIAKNAWQSLAPLFALLVAYQGDLVTKLALGGIAFTLVITIASLLSYWFFRYRVSADSILIRQGVIKKKQLDIKFDRIQGINTEQNIIYRALGLVTINFDTAGSAGNEGNLPAVTRAFADALRARIGGAAPGEETAEPVAKPAAAALVRLDWRDMIRIGLADRRALIVFAFIGPMADQLDENIEEFIADFVKAAAANGVHFDTTGGVTIGVVVVAALALVFILVSVAAAFLRYHNFELALDGRTLRSQGGLVTRHEHSMDLGKIQTIRLQQDIIQRWLKRYRMTARQAISGRKHRSGKVFTIPVVTAELADELRLRFLRPEAGRLTQDPYSNAFLPISPYYMRSRVLFGGVLPAVVAVIAFLPVSGPAALTFLLWPPLVSAAAYQSWRRAGYVHDSHEIVRRSGLLGYRTVALLFRKVQRITVTQSRYQRRKGLASLRLYMASGSVRIPYIDHDLAKQLRDFVLYRVESSRLAWH
jgi:putative membrane protein